MKARSFSQRSLADGGSDPGPENDTARAAALDQGFLWYSDPTGQAAVRNLMQMARMDDLQVVDARGDVVFRIKREVLEEAVGLFDFTRSRSGLSIRAHSKKAPDPSCSSAEGSSPTVRRRNQ